MRAAVAEGNVGQSVSALPDFYTRINILNPAVDASWDSRSNRVSACLEGTGRAMLNDIYSWYDDPRAPSVYWLTGGPGTGKSTTTITACQTFSRRKVLGASFCFHRDMDSCNNPDRLASTIAYQLCFRHPQLLSHIAQVSNDAILLAARPGRQLLELVIDPVRKVSGVLEKPILIVLDALDECEGEKAEDSISEALDVLIPAVSDSALKLKILITSRRERYLLEVLARYKANISSRQMEHFISLRDIELLVTSKLRNLQEVFKHKWVKDFKWPSDDDIREVLIMCGNVFLAAATILRLLESQPVEGNGPDPRTTLNMLREIHNPTMTRGLLATNIPLSLDSLYLAILKSAAQRHAKENEREQLRLLLAFIVLSADRLSPEEIDALLRITSQDYFPVLRAVIEVPDDGRPVKALHSSFHDFMTNPLRCTDSDLQFIDPKRYHARLADACLLELMSLKRDLFEVPGPETRNTDTKSRVSQTFSKDMCYAVKYWPMHVVSGSALGGDKEDGLVVQRLADFAEVGLLRWVEALSYLGHLGEARTVTESVVRNLAIRQRHRPLRNLLNDIGRFIREYHSIISEGAMHTYYSALPFVPSQTELYRRYASTEGPHRVTVTRGDIYWNPCLQTSRFEKPIISAAVSGDGAYIAVAFGRSVAILNAATGAQISTLKEIYGMRAIFLSIDGKYLLSLSSDNIIRTWDCRASKEIFGVTDSFRMHVAYVRANELASCIQKIQHVEKKKKRKELPTDIGEALQIAVSSDCKAILAADRWGDSLYMWCSESGRSLLRIHHAHGHKNERRVPSERPIVTCVAFSPEGTCFASGSIMETVKIRDSKTGDVLQTLSHGAEVCSVVFSPDGLSIVSGTAYGAVIFWDTKGGARLRSLKGPSERVTTLAFSSDAAFLVTGYRNSELKIWDCQFVAPTTREDTHSSSVNSIVVSKNGLLIASGSDDSTVRVWNAVDGKLQWKLSGHTYRVTELAISDDGSYIISGSTDRTLRVWSVQTGQATAVLSMESPVGILAFIAIKGLRFASAFSDGEITIWETTTGTKVKDLKGHTAQITSIAVSQDSSRLVSTSRSDGMTWVWDCTTLEAIYQLNSNTADLMAISPDASRMVTGAITFRIWDFKTGVELLNIPTNVRDENGQGDSAQELSFVHDGRYFMARYRSGQCLLWNSMTGERMAPPSPTFSPPKSEQVASSLTQHYTLSMGWIYEINLNGHFLPICKLPSASYKVTSTCFQDDICAVGLENGAVIIMRIPQLSRCRPAQSTSS